jgi:hypothetical protein
VALVSAFSRRAVLRRVVVSHPVEQFREIFRGLDAAPERYVSIIFAGLADNNRHLDICPECECDDRAGEFEGLLDAGVWSLGVANAKLSPRQLLDARLH